MDDAHCPQLRNFICQGSKNGCSINFERYGEVCYRLVKPPKSWEDAKTACTHMGGWLAEPKTKEQYAYFKSAIRGAGNVWYGGWKTGPSRTWLWASDDETISWFSWASHNPTNRNDQNCLMYWPGGGGMDDAHCPQLRNFICQGSKNGCSINFERYGEVCYRLVKQPKSWEDAKTACTHMGGWLA